MRLKQKLAATLAMMLIFPHVFSAFASAADQLLEQRETVTIQDSGTPLEPSDNQNKPFDTLPEQGASPTETPASPSDVDTTGEPDAGDTGLAPVLTEDSFPVFTANLVTEGEQPGLYVTLEHAPSELSMVRVQYSYGGLDYMEWDGKIWDNPGDLAANNGDLTLFCYGLNEYPLVAFQSEGVNSLYLKMIYDVPGAFDSVELEPIRFSHEKAYAIPEAPPFSADFKMEGGSYTVIGHFRDFAPNVARVRSAYSWDGITYHYSNPEWPSHWLLNDLGNEDAAARQRLENQEIAKRYEEPLQSFLAHQRDSFYLRLEITTEDNEQYFSQAAYISRGERRPLPENLTPRVSLGFDLAVSETRNDNGNAKDDEAYYPELLTYTHGQYQLSVREDATAAEIMALLPDTVPVRVILWDKGTKEKYAFGDLACPVVWKVPPAFTLTPGVPLVLADMAELLLIPAGTDVVTALGPFTLQKPLTFKSQYDSDAIDLVLTPIAAGDGPTVALQAYNLDFVGENGEDRNETRIDEPLSLAFWNKPSGASAIKAVVVVDGVRTAAFDLLERRAINHNQSHALYGYIDLLQPEEYPYQDYLSGELAGFSIELAIVGGVYDGKQLTLPWPMAYDAPKEIFDPYDIDGNENNAGSNFEEIDEDEDTAGQRPDLPQEPEKPPEEQPESPPITGPPSDGGPDKPDELSPELLPQPPLELPPPTTTVPESSTEPPPDHGAVDDLFDGSSGGDVSVVPTQPLLSLRPPQSEESVPAVGVPRDDTEGRLTPIQTKTHIPDPPPPQTEEPVASIPEPPPSQTEEPVASIPSNDRQEAAARQQPDRETETHVDRQSFPMMVTAAVVLVGSVIAVSVGASTASGAAAGGGFAGKILCALRRFFPKR